MTNVALFHTCIWDWYASDNNTPVTARCSRKKPSAAVRPHAVCGRPMLIHTYHAVPLPFPCRGFESSLSEGYIRGMARELHGNDMVCVNQTRPNCVNQTRKTKSNSLEKRNDRGTAWQGNGMAGERHGKGMVMCESALRVLHSVHRVHSYVLLILSTHWLLIPHNANSVAFITASFVIETTLQNSQNLLAYFPLSSFILLQSVAVM
jgi:hypothetical protein